MKKNSKEYYFGRKEHFKTNFRNEFVKDMYNPKIGDMESCLEAAEMFAEGEWFADEVWAEFPDGNWEQWEKEDVH